MSATKVLIAEDNLQSQQLLRLILASEGFIVTAAADGEKAIDILREIRPDVVVTDLLLPSVSGGDLIRHVRGTAELISVSFSFARSSSETSVPHTPSKLPLSSARMNESSS